MTLLSRRRFALAAAATTLAAPALAQEVFRFPAEWLPTDVAIAPGLPAGAIHVDIAGTWLYLTLADGVARRYKIAVGAAGRNFQGTARVGRKAEWPSWTPTASMIRMEPEVYGPFRGGLPGGHPYNPLGARALYLYQGSRDTMYRIHGTPQPWTIGQSFSSGCIRMHNDHAIDLYDRVPVGTPVFVR
ncbi:L,D-transpeptidase [Rubellimicrobium sp. CFH 75288]|uniref:L,D-transpeptidase n=1 Tax=Rubellimicrobium sp. CFH 75288 TaxID=2697034 RepID=UPI0014128E60|nr:L,D-transpeptidase [Rubellimicrobium sp. CFH 75288]NAZ37532.1 L,D-transpeptidase family protein [Rubellimicrobium sp. CFH 75288]